jgi:hypothetical protein
MVTNETFFLSRNFVMTVYLFKFLNNKLSLKTVLVNYLIKTSYNLFFFFLFGTVNISSVYVAQCTVQ